MKIPTQCPMCEEITVIEVPDDEWEAYQAGALIQHALVSVPREVREQLVSGVDDKCWKKMFPETEE